MLFLGIESSCDETGVALVQAARPSAPHELPKLPPLPKLLGQTLHTQAAMHADYGGVVPELASRDHIQRVVPLTLQALQAAGKTLHDVDAIAYTAGPGLAGALLVGAGFAQSLAAALGKPSAAIHHLEGHLLSPFLSATPPTFPFIALLVSGGHTQLMHVHSVGRYELLGETIDDAAGEAFDKCAKLLGLGYPGGAALAKLALQGNPKAYALPRPLLKNGNLDFSFAGLKTAVLTLVNKLHAASQSTSQTLDPQLCADVAASTQAAIVDVLVAKSVKAMAQTGVKTLVVSGGVSANSQLREQLNQCAATLGGKVFYPELALCGDNAAMIALAAAMRWQAGTLSLGQSYAFNVRPRWDLATV